MPLSPTGGSMHGNAGFLPRVSPLRLGAGVDPASHPESRPREIVRLTSGERCDSSRVSFAARSTAKRS